MLKLELKIERTPRYVRVPRGTMIYTIKCCKFQHFSFDYCQLTFTKHNKFNNLVHFGLPYSIPLKLKESQRLHPSISG